MKTIGLIPARMSSSRFPGKPLKMIAGKELLLRVYENASNSKLIDTLYIATCDEIIKERMLSLGCNVIMTGKHHERCTSRCAEALVKIESKINKVFDNILIIQGDEPLVRGKDIDEATELLIKNKEIKIVNLVSRIEKYEEYIDRNTIKVTLNNNDEIIYMSRGEIPFSTKNNFEFAHKQIGVMHMKREILKIFEKYSETKLEKIESIDMLRLIENKILIKAKLLKYKTQAVDVLSDINKVESIILNE